MVKNTIKTALMLFLAWLWLPSGPSDFLFIPAIIGIVGWNAYLIISGIIVYILYKSIDGRTIKDKFNNIKKEIGWK